MPLLKKDRNLLQLLKLPDFSVLAIYIFFCYLMLRIVLQYTELGSDTAFLGIKQEYIGIPLYLPAFYIHVFAAIFALPAGLTQFSRTILKKWPVLHRLNGRAYVFSIVSLGGPSGFIIGLYANGGLYSRIAFCLLGALWIFFTAMAWRKALQRDFRSHKAYMYRSFALSLSAITLRAWKYLLTALLHWHPMDAYKTVAWLGWTLNLCIAEYIIHKHETL